MQADPGNLLTLTGGTTRIVAVLVEFNWAKDAVDLTNPSSGTWIDESAWLEDIAGQDAIRPPGASALQPAPKEPASCSIVLTNNSNASAVPRYASGRTDSLYYARTASGAIHSTPIRVWIGYMELTVVALGVTLSGAMAAGVAGARVTFNLSAAGTVTKGMVLLIDSELIPVMAISGATCYGYRGYRGTTAAAHSNGAATSRAGGLTTEFVGGVQQASENPSAGTVTIECLDRSMFLGHQRASSILYQEVNEKVLLQNFLALANSNATYAPVPTGQQSLDGAIFNMPFGFLDDEQLYDQCGMVAASVAGLFRFTKEGVARYENMQAWYGAASQWTFTSTEMENVTPQPDYASVFTDMIVFFSPRYLGVRQVVFELTRYISIAPGASQTRTFNLNLPSTGVTVPAVTTFTASEKHDTNDVRDVAGVAGNLDITSSLALSGFTANAQRVDVTFTNNHTSLAMDVTRFRLWGQPVIGGPVERVPLTRATIPAGLPQQTATVSSDTKYNWFLLTEEQATSIGTFLVNRMRRARPLYPIAGARHVPQLEVGDLVTLTWTKPFSASPTGYVLSKSWRIEGLQSESAKAVMDVVVLDSTGMFESSNYFKVGTSATNAAKVVFG